MKVLLLSAYAARSHVYWHENLTAMFPDWNWQILSLPPRHFSWRVRGNPLYWALEEREKLEGKYELLICTSMVDLATLRGLVPNLATLPTLLYFHENQFEYPEADTSAQSTKYKRREHNSLEAQMVSLYSSLAADCMVFNSHYNQASFLQGCDALLNRLPDKVPADIVSLLRAKSTVLPVPLKDHKSPGYKGESKWGGGVEQYPRRALRLLWVGRFEYDKGGDRLLRVLSLLEQCGLPYELAVVGQQFRNSPPAFSRIKKQFEHRLVQYGFIDLRADYLKTLAEADIVLSTAVHEFQGIAVLEAVAAACMPVLPRRLVYPEILPSRNCYPSHLDDIQLEAEGAVALIVELARKLGEGSREVPDVSGFGRAQLKPRYLALIDSLC